MNLEILGKYGGCVYDTLVDRINVNSIKIKSAWVRPENNPFVPKLNVTEGFERLLSSKGGITLLNQDVTVRELTSPPQPKKSIWQMFSGAASITAAASATARAAAVTAQAQAQLQQHPASAVSATARAAAVTSAAPAEEPHWLCVCFSIPGDSEFIACYRLPSEQVTFPPLSTDPRGLVRADRQIISATMVCDTYSDDDPSCDNEGDAEDEEERTLLDFTPFVQKMAGPNGDFFGRDLLDLRTAMADSMESSGRTHRLLVDLLDLSETGKSARARLEYADGSVHYAGFKKFNCNASLPTTEGDQ